MNDVKTIRQNRYFAAQNSYMGFKSHFDEIFNPKDYAKIYILKGGPGTGKSSFMKEIASHFNKLDFSTDEIYCSSDIKSLDGVIIYSGNIKIAIIDGTSPHSRDPKLPGAVEEIIDLGMCWDKRWLEGRRQVIIDLVSEKEKAYKTAYSYLNIAGHTYNEFRKAYSSIFDKTKAKSLAETIIPNDSKDDKLSVESNLTSAFGKNGYVSLDETFCVNRDIILSGMEIVCDLFFDIIYDELIKVGCDIIRFLSPLDENITEKIYIKRERVMIKRGSNNAIDLNHLIQTASSMAESAKACLSIRDQALDEASRWFSIASDIHFRLEEIYGEAMNFNKNQEIIREKIPEIENILQNTR